MSGYSTLNWFLGSLLYVVPLCAQVETIARGPLIPDPIPSAPVHIVSPSPGVTLPVSPSAPVTPFPGRDGMSVMPPPVVSGDQTSSVLTQANQERDPISNLLDFWFGYLPGPDFFPQSKMPLWVASGPEMESAIVDNFEQELLRAQRGEYNHWRDTPRGRLALILLLDQIPRHIYRNQPRQFMLDRMARALVLEGIQKGDDKHLYPIERVFFYLPLEHAEDLGLQNLSVTSYRQLVVDSPLQIKPQMQDFLQAAIIHQQQIARFGRFPYRNAILGRESTPEETLFLMQWRNF